MTDNAKLLDIIVIVVLVITIGVATWSITVYLDASDEARSYMHMAAAGGIGALIAAVICVYLYFNLRPVKKRADRK